MWSDEIEFAQTDNTLEFIHMLKVLWRQRLPLRVTSITVGVTFYFGGAYSALDYTPMHIAFYRISDPTTKNQVNSGSLTYECIAKSVPLASTTYWRIPTWPS